MERARWIIHSDGGAGAGVNVPTDTPVWVPSVTLMVTVGPDAAVYGAKYEHTALVADPEQSSHPKEAAGTPATLRT